MVEITFESSILQSHSGTV